jgi:hypothetical protein
LEVQNIVEDILIRIIGRNIERMKKQLLKLALYYKPTGKGNRGCPWKDQFLDESWWNKCYMPKIQLVKEEKNHLNTLFFTASFIQDLYIVHCSNQ